MTVDAKLDDLISAYLDGELDTDETRRLEERLGDSEVASTLSRELGLRDWLKNVGPESPPDPLAWQLELAVTTELPMEAEAGEAKPARFPTLRAALAGMSWMARGPAMAVSTQGGPVYGATMGLGTIGYTVAPLISGRTPRKKKTVSTKRKLGSLAWKLLRRK